MPFVANQGEQIHYDVEGNGEDLILAHGLTFSGEDWRELGYIQRLGQAFRVNMIDARGHGKSSKPHDPLSYSPQNRVKDVLAVLDDLGRYRAHYWGYSAGGVPGFCAAKFAPDRFKSVIIGGLDPYPDSRDIGDRSPPARKPISGLPEGPNPVKTLFESGGDAWLDFIENNIEVPPGMKARLRRNDFAALGALLRSPYRWRDEVGPELAAFPFSCLLYAGEAEDSFRGMQNCAEEMPRAEFYPVPGSSHLDIFADPDCIVPRVIRFLSG